MTSIRNKAHRRAAALADKETRSKSNSIVVNTLVVKPNTRSVADIKKWRDALKLADRGKREKLYDLYEDLLIDSVLFSAIDKRITSITNSEITFTGKNGEPVPEIDALIDTPEFEEVIKEILQAKFWGKTVLELGFSSGGLGVYPIPRTNIRVDKGLIVVNATDETGVPYKDDDFFIEAGDDKDLGLILKCAPYVIYKRGGFGDWAQFAEIFGMPFRLGKYGSHDDDGRQVLEQALEKQGSASYMVIPKETDVEIVQSTTNANGMLYDRLREACNEEMLYAIVGQTMTTVSGASKSQSETHMTVQENLAKSDRRFVQRILNTKLLPRLEKRGFPVAGGFFSFPEAGETLSSLDKLKLYTGIKKDLECPIDETFIYEAFGVPKGKAVETKKEETPPEPPKGTEKPPKEKMADEPREGFWKEFFNFFHLAPAQEVGACCGGHHSSSVNLAAVGEFETNALLDRVVSGEAAYFDPELFRHFAKTLTDGLNKGFAAKEFISRGIEYGFDSDSLKTAMEVNLFQFSAAKTLVEVQELNKAFRAAKSVDEFKTEASKITSVFNKTWLQTEYDTAYLTAESSAAYYRQMEEVDIFPYGEYVTVGDGKVREEHAKLHGIILPMNDPRWLKIYPPNGWKCRCRRVPRTKAEVEGVDFAKNRKAVDEYFKTPEWKQNAAQGFDVNRAVTGEVFTKNQMYINKFKDNSSKLLGEIYANSWGLDEIGKCIAKATTELKPFTGKADEWFTANAKEGVVKFADYNGREVMLSKETLGAPAEYLDELKNILANPSEVWLNDYGKEFSNLVFVKYYKNNAITVVTSISEGKVYGVDTWLKIDTSDTNKTKRKNTKWRFRRGLLIK